MIRLIEALNFRCLRDIHRSLGPFHVLVGPNASGKTTFLDAVGFLGKFVSQGLDAVIEERTRNFEDLLWMRQGNCFELAIEAAIPEDLRNSLPEKKFDTIRYEISIGIDQATGERSILSETVLLKVQTRNEPRQLTVFPEAQVPRHSILLGKGTDRRYVINKVPGGNDNFYSEVYGESGKGWLPSFKLGPRRSALGNLPEDESKFPVSTWLKRLLAEGVQQLVLNSLLIRKASPPGQTRTFKPDGSNLPWVLESLQQREPERYRWWLEHVRTALPDVEEFLVIERQDDKHKYLKVRYRGGLEAPSWMLSDGTLRLLALTLLAYLPDFRGIFLIEEPENGIHPLAVETVLQSLSSVYGAQVLVATHSPVILGSADPKTVLCFAKSAEGATCIVPGDEHPALASWKGETNLGTLFAAGVLG